MIEAKILELLLEEHHKDHFITRQQITDVLNVSSKTISNRINSLNNSIPKSVATVEGIPGKGYKLVIFDREKLEKFMIQLRLKEDFSNRDYRIQYIISSILLKPDKIYSEELERNLFISRSQLFSDLKIIREYASKYDLNFSNNNKYGIEISGSEVEIRNFISTYCKDYSNQTLLTLAEMNRIEESVLEFFHEEKIEVADFIFEDFMNYIYIMIIRIKLNYSVSLLEIKAENLSSLFEIAHDIYSRVETIVYIERIESETNYLMMLLAGKVFIDNHEKSEISNIAENIVLTMLEKINTEREIDFRNSNNLKILLVHHTIPLIHRIQSGHYLNNELLPEIKSRFIAAFDLANIAVGVINNHFNVVLSDDEIGYYALHFQVALSKQLEINPKYNILIICSSGKGTSQLLKYQFISEFGNFISNLETSNMNGLSQLDLEQYDYIFSTIPLSNINVFSIPHFLDESSIKEITSFFKEPGFDESIFQYFPESLFLGRIQATSREEVLEKMVLEISKYKEIPNNFLDEVFRREEISSTDMLEGVAFPHPNTPLTDTTFVSVACLDKPMVWGSHEVNIVFLAAIEKGDIKDLQKFYKIMSKLMTQRLYLNQLTMEPKYSVLKDIIQKID